MTKMTDSEPVCKTCGNTRKNHDMFKHPFQVEDGGPDWVPPKEKAKKPDLSGPVTRSQQLVIAPAPDLALRSLLVAKGLITDAELKEAEYALRFPDGAHPVPVDGGHPQ